MSTAASIAGTTALFALCLAATRLGPGWAAWPRADKANYLLLTAAVWPWLFTSLFTTPPTAYTIAVVIVGGTAMTWFITSQFRFLRRMRQDLARLQADTERLRREGLG